MLAALCFLGLLVLLPAALLAANASTSTTTAVSVTAATTRGARGPLPGTVTCATVQEKGSAAALPAAFLRALQPQEASSCVALLGKDPLAEDQARAVWDILLQAFQTADMIPDETIRLLGWVAAGIPPDHLANLSLSEIDTVATLGAFHNLSTEQLSTLAESVRMQWSAKEPEDLSHLDLAALNHILCGFNASDIGRIHADAYKEAASSLSLLRCPGMPGAVPLPGAGDGSTPGVVMVPGVDPGGGTLPVRALALLAESGDAFGDPSGWGASTVRAVGCVLVGLPAASVVRVPAAAMHAMLQALAGSEQPVVRQCLYGTPAIAQKLSSSDQPQTAAAVASTTLAPNVTAAGGIGGNATTASNSTAVAATSTPRTPRTTRPQSASGEGRQRQQRPPEGSCAESARSSGAAIAICFIAAWIR